MAAVVAAEHLGMPSTAAAHLVRLEHADLVVHVMHKAVFVAAASITMVEIQQWRRW